MIPELSGSLVKIVSTARFKRLGCQADPSRRRVALTYHGKLRASTGLSLLHGFTELQKKADLIKLRESM
jgi:hypothetical protein